MYILWGVYTSNKIKPKTLKHSPNSAETNRERERKKNRRKTKGRGRRKR